MLERLSIQQRFRALLVFSLACFALCGAIVYLTLTEIRVNGPIYERIMQGEDLVADILPPPAYLVESYLTARQLYDAPDAVRRERLRDRLRKLEAEYQQRYRHWREAGLEGELQIKFLSESHALALSFYDMAFQRFVPAVLNQDRAVAAQALARLGTTYEAQRKVIEQVVLLARARNLADEAAARTRIGQMALALTLVFGATVLAFVWIFNTVRRSIADPIIEALNITRRIAAGDWNHQFQHTGNDEAAHLLTAIKEIVRHTQTELVKSGKMAALGSLVAGVSHELNTPVGNGLMAVSTLSDDLRAFRGKMENGLRRSALDEYLASVEQGADIATRNLQRAADLMRSFKQVAVDRSSAQRRRFRLDQVVDETRLTLLPMLKRARCQVRVEIAPDIELDSFPGALGQVVSNMVENAAKHAFDEDGGVVTVSARRPEGGTVVVVAVADDGKGIPAEMQEHVFEPFFTTRLGQGGSGLGLHISHNLVYQALGGSIALVSQPGRGALFEITIPLAAPCDLAAAA